MKIDDIYGFVVKAHRAGLAGGDSRLCNIIHKARVYIVARISSHDESCQIVASLLEHADPAIRLEAAFDFVDGNESIARSVVATLASAGGSEAEIARIALDYNDKFKAD